MAGGMAGRIITIITTIITIRLRLARRRSLLLMVVFIGVARRADIFMEDITAMVRAAESF